MSKIAFSLGPFDFYWYGLIVAASVLIGLVITILQAWFRHQPTEIVLDLVLYGVPTAMIGARLLYVLLNLPVYVGNPVEAFYIWHGGLVGYGALLSFLAVLYIYARQHELSLRQWLDIVSPGLAMGLAAGQWGNFVNQEGFGYPTSLAWGIYIDYAYRPPGYEQFDYFQPLFLYESVWNLLVFFILQTIVLLQGRRPPARAGKVFLLFLLLVSLGRFAIESLRLDVDPDSGRYILQGISLLGAGSAIWLLNRFRLFTKHKEN